MSQGTLGTGCIGGRDTACGAVAPGTRSLRSTERYWIDRAIHSLVCCSTREARRRDALLPRVRSFINPRTTLSQDNLGRKGESAVTEDTEVNLLHCCFKTAQNILLVRENSWKLLTVGYVQLLQDALRPARHLPSTGTALQALGGHEVPAVPVQDPPDGLVPSSARQLALTGRAAEVVCPRPVGQPQEEGALEEGVSCGGWLGVEGPGSWRVPPHAVVIEDSWPAACLREESPAHPLLLLYRQRPSPAQGQHLKHTANQSVSVNVS